MGIPTLLLLVAGMTLPAGSALRRFPGKAAAGARTWAISEEGSRSSLGDLEDLTPGIVDEDPSATANFSFERSARSGMPLSPPMTLSKYQTMRNKRVVLTIRYSGGSGLKAAYEAAAAIIKERFPDVLVQRTVLEVQSQKDEDQFEILVDGKLAYLKRKDKPGVFLQMDTLEQFIRRARRRRRPDQLVYGDMDTYEPEHRELLSAIDRQNGNVEDTVLHGSDAPEAAAFHEPPAALEAESGAAIASLVDAVDAASKEEEEEEEEGAAGVPAHAPEGGTALRPAEPAAGAGQEDAPLEGPPGTSAGPGEKVL